MEIERAFGQVIRELRYGQDLSQEALAHESGLDRSYLSELENGRKTPSVRTVFRLAGALGLSASDLIATVEKELARI